jgi:hypothetical protein
MAAQGRDAAHRDRRTALVPTAMRLTAGTSAFLRGLDGAPAPAPPTGT